jgi:hypothetical protein
MNLKGKLSTIVSVMIMFGLFSQPSGAVTDVFGWEFGRPLESNGKVDGPEDIDGPFLNLDYFSLVERGERTREGGFRHRSKYKNQSVVVQSTAKGIDAVARKQHNRFVELAQTLGTEDLGPKFLGTVFVPVQFAAEPSRGMFALVLLDIEGSTYRPVYRPYSIQPRKRLPKGVRPTAQIMADIEQTFDILNWQKIIAVRPEFLLTVQGRAFLINYQDFRPANSVDEATASNLKVRQVFLDGILHNWRRDCSLALKMSASNEN